MAQSASIIISNAHVFTADFNNPSAEAVAIVDNQILFVGSNADAKNFQGASTRRIDAQGYTLMPGIIDSHYHLLLGSVELGYLHVGDAKTLFDLRDKLFQHMDEYPKESSYNATGLSYDILFGEALTRHHLDAIVEDRPLIIMSFDGHTVWVNTRALEIADMLQGKNIDSTGTIVMDEKDGIATGELRESAAYGHVLVHFPAWARVAKGLGGNAFADVKIDTMHERQLLREGLRLAAQFGITRVHNMDGDMEQAGFYAAMDDSGDLSLRVSVPYSVKPYTTVQDLDEAVEMMCSYQSDKVHAGQAKFFMDGVIESWTGFLLDDYADRPNWKGEALYSAEHFNRMAAECDKRGLQIAVHAIGDAAVRRTLDGFEYAQSQNGRRDSRHRVEHIELIHPDDLPRFAKLDVIASIQPLHSPLDFPATADVYLDRVGEDRWHRAFAWQYLRGAGARMAFGSDWSVVSPDPLLGIHAALNRKAWADGLPDHRQSLQDTLLSYTRDGAYAEFMEHKKGQLKAGMLADLVLLSADLFKTAPEAIKDVRPVMTLCDGRIVYEA